MNSPAIQQLARDWTRLGAMFNVAPAARTPDLERLLLRTACLAGESLPQFIMAITWLAAYGEMVARQRLARLVQTELPPASQPAMGLMLDSVVALAPRHECRFRGAIACCARQEPPGPLLEVDRRNGALARLARGEATALSKRWGLWLGPVELKTDALRPAEWIAAHNPGLAWRALTGGDLVATILAEAQAAKGYFKSEVELARRCGASRPAIREALQKLRLGGYARQALCGRSNEIFVGRVARKSDHALARPATRPDEQAG